MVTQKMPALFVTDFGPFPAFHADDYTLSLNQLGNSLPRPKAIVIMSGHWEVPGKVMATSSTNPGVIYDYSGFPKRFYTRDYPCPGEPTLAEELVKILLTKKISAQADDKRGLDHGAWVPLTQLFPAADIPVIQISVMPGEQDARAVFETGRALEKLREQGILLIGSGAFSHNLSLLFRNKKNAPPEPWAVEFDHWVMDKLTQHDYESLFKYPSLSPHAKLAVPSAEHFNPLFFVLGASSGGTIRSFYHNLRFGNGILRSFTLS